jgi:hypothetical protein
MINNRIKYRLSNIFESAIYLDNIEKIDVEKQFGAGRLSILDSAFYERDKFITEFKELCGVNYVPSILGKVPRIIVFGDIHGDYKLMKNMFELSGVAKEVKRNTFLWTGGATYVVQVGDQIDRCRPIGNMRCDNKLTTQNDEDSDIDILQIFTNLNEQAVRMGGAVISLLGNHEIKNSQGQLEYVSYEGLHGFDSYVDKKNPGLIFDSGESARKHAFAPGNEMGKFLGCTRIPAIIIGSNLFVHAGLVDGLIKEIGLTSIEDFESINIAIRKWLLGMLDVRYIQHIINGSKYSLFWTRILGSIPANVGLDNPICNKNLKEVFRIFNAKIGGIVIGHTPQSFTHSDDINGTCSNKVWRVDNGSSAAFDKFDRHYMTTGEIDRGRRPQFLEILDDHIYKVHG